MNEEITLEELKEEGERICTFTVTGAYFPFHFLAPKDVPADRLDIAGCIEETLHRLIDAGASEGRIYAILGVLIPDEEERETLEEFDEYVPVDLGYVIPGLVEQVNG